MHFLEGKDNGLTSSGPSTGQASCGGGGQGGAGRGRGRGRRRFAPPAAEGSPGRDGDAKHPAGRPVPARPRTGMFLLRGCVVERSAAAASPKSSLRAAIAPVPRRRWQRVAAGMLRGCRRIDRESLRMHHEITIPGPTQTAPGGQDRGVRGNANPKRPFARCVECPMPSKSTGEPQYAVTIGRRFRIRR